MGGFEERCFPYTNLSNLDNLENVSVAFFLSVFREEPSTVELTILYSLLLPDLDILQEFVIQRSRTDLVGGTFCATSKPGKSQFQKI